MLYSIELCEVFFCCFLIIEPELMNFNICFNNFEKNYEMKLLVLILINTGGKEKDTYLQRL